MTKNMKIWMILGAALVVLGMAVAAGALCVGGWDLTQLDTGEYETNTYEIGDPFHHISVNTDIADVVLLPSEDGQCRVVCREETRAKHIVTVREGVLEIEVADERKWYDHVGINFGDPQITVYVPDGQMRAVFVTATTGDISLEDMKLEELRLTVSTGRISLRSIACQETVYLQVSTGTVELADLTCRVLESRGSTGNIKLQNVTASESFCLKRSTGKVIFDGCDAPEVLVETSTGDVEGTLLSGKAFRVQSSTGSVEIPESFGEQPCVITTSTGDVRIRLN